VRGSDRSGSGKAGVEIRRGGVYLITGGAGGLGRIFARYLCERWGAKVALLGRSEKIDALRIDADRTQGEVVYFQADVCDPRQLEEVLSRVRSRFGDLHGVIHAAGIQSRGQLPWRSQQEFEAVLAPKVRGTLVLEEVLRRSCEAPLDFVCFFSSSSAVLGDFGSCDYAVANRFQLAYARRNGPPEERIAHRVLAIAWPLWRASGMGFEHEGAERLYLKSSGQRALDADEGVALFEQLLAAASCTHLVMAGKADRLHEMLGAQRVEPQRVSEPTMPAVERIASPGNPRLRGLSLEQCVQTEVAGIASDLLKIAPERLEWHVNLAEYGFDSITLARFARLLTGHFAVEITPAVFFDHETIAKVAGFLLRHHRELVRGLYLNARAADTDNQSNARMAASGVRPKVAPEAGPGCDGEPLAVIGMSGRFPGARTVQDLWRILEAGREVVTTAPAERADWVRFKSESAWDQACRLGAIDGVAEFDAAFFEISPREAQGIDPRARLLLQESWNALEDAGCVPSSLRVRRVGMYVGVEQGEYSQLIGENGDAQGALTGNHDAILASRLGYFLDLRGPAMAINASCASGLVALHQACLSLRARDCELAIVASANLLLTPQTHAVLNQSGMLSSGGRCRAFAHDADGIVPGEAVVAVVLKPLSRAQADGDPIRAVIRASGINYDGKTNGLTAPSGAAQSELVRSVYEKAGLRSQDVQYIVTHGTGTALGDPVEIRALQSVFDGEANPSGRDVDSFGRAGLEGPEGGEERRCALTSTKANFGHTFAASGLLSLVSLVKALEHETIPASLHCEELSEHIDWVATRLYVNRQSSVWQEPVTGVRRGAVSSFGMSGTNAHVVVEGYDAESSLKVGSEADSRGELPPQWVLIVSAKTDEALQARIRDLCSVLEGTSCARERLHALSFTLLTGREHFPCRCAIVAEDSEQALLLLRDILEGRTRQGQSLERLFLGKVPPEFVAQPVLQQMADELVIRVSGMRSDPSAYRQGLCALAQLYVQGYPLGWEALFAASKPRRVPLPGYPFARDAHWWSASTSPPAPVAEALSAAKPATIGRLVLLSPQWVVTPPSGGPLDRSGDGTVLPRQYVFLDPIYKSELPALEALDGSVRFDLLPPTATEALFPPDRAGWADETAALAAFILGNTQRILNETQGTAVVVQVVLGRDGREAGECALRLSLSAWLRSVRQENPNFRGCVLDVAEPQTPEELSSLLRDLASPRAADLIRIEAGQIRTIVYEQREDPSTPEGGSVAASRPWKDGGVYWIVGGAGGLGRLLAREIIATAREPTVVLSGRSKLDAEEIAVGLSVSNAACRLAYEPMDVSDAEDVARCVDRILKSYGRIDGIVHAAGVVRDRFAIRQNSSALREVLAPKVTGTVNLDRATAHLPLDFFVLCSSVSGVWGNSGQADYALASSFQEHYAHYRSELVAAGRRQGRTLCIDWSLWASGGMRVDAQGLERLRGLGIVPLPTDEAIQALYRAYRSGEPSVVALYGVSHLLEQTFGYRTAALADRTLCRLRELLSQVLRLDVARVDVDAPFDTFGIDSLLVLEINRHLEQHFAALPKTLFFEHRTLRSLSAWLLASHGHSCAAWVRANEGASRGPPQRPVFTAQSSRQPPTPDVADRSAPAREPLAIIGISGQYPHANTLDELWENLKSGRDCIGEIPPERWDLDGFYEPDAVAAAARGRSYSKWGAFLERFAEFDAAFFGISPREARNMDPQERLFLQSCWAALEDAAYTRQRLSSAHRNRVGVFAGVTKTGFDLLGPELWNRGVQAFPHTSFSSIANRVSYFLDLRGPSMPIDTMCSASLTAIHEACEHLLRDECELALAGGVNLYTHPASYIGLCAQRMLSVDGRCRSFGKGGSGFVPGEGVGVVLLKRLSHARRDGDRIHAVVRATSINHGGRTNGYTVPNPAAQAEVVMEALRRANVPPRAISYIEAHGTGTELGDPIEIAGLTQAFGNGAADRQFCAVGSIKSNLGHGESVAGIAGLTKVILQMRHERLAPSLHASELNPHIEFATTPFFVQTELGPWIRPIVESQGRSVEYPRMAGVSSFGAGGANAHVIVEEYRASLPSSHRDQASVLPRPMLIPLSARTQAALTARIEQLRQWLESMQCGELENVAHTLQIGREAMEHRIAFTATSTADLSRKLAAVLGGEEAVDGCHRAEPRRPDGTMTRISGDVVLRSAVDTWMADGQYGNVLDLWVRGFDIDWGVLYRDAGRSVLSLPTYPFARERHWFPPAQAAADLLMFEERWEVQEIRRAADDNNPKHVVCVLDDPGMRAWYRSGIEASGCGSRVVFIGSADAEEEYARLLQAAEVDHGRIDAIVDLRALERPEVIRHHRPIVDLLRGVARAGVASARVLISMSAAPVPEGRDDSALDWCYAQSWMALERSWPRTTSLGAVSIVCGDEAAIDAQTIAAWAARLRDELSAASGENVSYRGGRRHVMRLIEARSSAETASAIRPGGTYLIAGGAGGLGRLLTQYLVREYGANVVVTGRSALGDAERASLQSQELTGETVVYCQADVCDVEEMRRVVGFTVERFGELHGVIHASGLQSDRSLLEKSEAAFEAVLAPKVRGSIALHAAIEGRKLDFVCHFSSASALIGDFGSCDYAIANRFQTAYARSSDTPERPTIAINWPLWDEGGMGFDDPEATRLYLRSSGQLPLSTIDGLAAFERLVAQRAPQRLVLVGRRERLLAIVAGGAQRPNPRQGDTPRLHPALPEPVSANPAEGIVSRRIEERLIADLRRHTGEILLSDLQRIDPDANLADLGFDSIGLAELAARVSQQYAIAFTAGMFFRCPTISRLTRYLLSEHAAILQIHYGQRGVSDVRHSDDSATRMAANE
jgi:acyl transferase domain-containing protein/NAD(P)-dependent dehydrogenase (short-subunit alcohol dehydrogenase family)/acyl carrier protein